MAGRDPIKEYVRTSRAQRRVGIGAACACGEERPFGLIPGRTPPLCYACDQKADGLPPFERNHVFGRHNSALTIRYPINDHRAIFSVDQYDWPPGALENPHGNALLGAIARFHGLYKNVEYMLADCRTFSAQLTYLEGLLCMLYGPNWLPGLETAAKRASRKRKIKRRGKR